MQLCGLPYKPSGDDAHSEFMCFPFLLFCLVLYPFLVLTAPCRVWDLGLLTRNRTCTACIGNWKRGVNHRLPRGVLIWLLFISARAFSDSPCFFHQTVSALSAFYCASETHLLSLSLSEDPALSSAWLSCFFLHILVHVTHPCCVMFDCEVIFFGCFLRHFEAWIWEGLHLFLSCAWAHHLLQTCSR